MTPPRCEEPPLCDGEPGPRDAVPGPAGGAADEHDASTRPAAPAATTAARRDLRRLRQPTRIPIRLLSLTTSMTLTVHGPPRAPRCPARACPSRAAARFLA